MRGRYFENDLVKHHLLDYFRRGVEALNPGLFTFPLSCRTGQGLEDWMAWVVEWVERDR